MQVTVSARHMTVDEAVKDYCQEKVGRLERLYDRIQAVEIILDGRSGVHTAEILVHTDHTQPFVAKEQQEDLYAAVDILIDKIQRQLRDHKGKLRNRKHPPRPPTEEQGP